MQDHQRYIQIIEALAGGADPKTGELLPAQSPYQDAEVTRALFHALQVLKVVEKEPQKSGAKWTMEQETQLKTAYEQGASVGEIAKAMQRSYGSIRARLIKLDLLTLNGNHMA